MTVTEQAWLPEFVYVDGEFRSDVAVVVNGERTHCGLGVRK